jgi:dihydroflavonol-4-reductase
MVVVTGATGHVGNALVRLLVSKGERVRAMAMPGEDACCLDALGVDVVRADVLDPGSLKPLLAGADVVYHLAGIIAIRPGAEELMRSVNVTGTMNVARAAREAGVRRMVHVSSIHALRRPALGVTIEETAGFDPDNPAGEYDRTKAQASVALLEEAKRGLDVVIVCPTGIVGPEDYRGSEVGQMFRTWLRRRPHLMVDGAFDWIDVRDVARGMVLAAERGRRGDVYILSGTRTTVREFYQLVKMAAGHRAPALSIPFRLALRAAPVMVRIAGRLGRQAKFTVYSLETLASNSVISSAKARRDLGFVTRPLEQTVMDTVAWWRARLRPPVAQLGRGKVAVVTGASSGIGALVASRLGSLGYHMVLVGRRQDRLVEVAREIEERGGSAEALVADLATPEGPRLVHQHVTARHGGADVLVNNAGFGWYGYYADMPWETAADMIAVNATAVASLASLFLPGMRARGSGHSIKLCSVAGSIPSQGVAVYCATKSFVDSFTTALYRELRGSGVHASAVRPGPVLTEFYRTAARLPSARPVPAERFAISAAVVAQSVVALLRRPRRVAYVPGTLRITPWIEASFGWIIDRVGPLLLRHRPVVTG